MNDDRPAQNNPLSSLFQGSLIILILTNLRLQSDLPLLLLQPQLAQPDPRHNPSQHEHTCDNDRPMLDMRHIQTIRRPRRRAYRRKPQRCDHVAANPVVLVDALRIVHAAVQTRGIVLGEPDDGLDVHQHVEGEAEDRVRGLEVLVPGAGFVELDDDETRGQCRGAEDVEEEVGEGTGAFLLGGVGWLKDECGLDGEEETSGVQELWLGQWLFKNGRVVELTGWAEKKINFWERMAPQIMAASC